MTKTLSIIIPAINEESNLTSTLAEIFAHQDQPDEVILVDGGSSDNSVDVANSYGCITLSSAPGRAIQMNKGAVAATGDNLLFLHADTLLPPNYKDQITKILDDRAIALGAFSLSFATQERKMCFIAWCANLRSRYCHLPYGDQGLFINSARFKQSGGFPEIAIMEDFAFVQKLKASGKIITLPERIITSHRRWQNIGVIKTTLINQVIVMGYFFGVSPNKLVKIYRRLQGLSPAASKNLTE